MNRTLRRLLILVMTLAFVPFVLANKGCEKAANFVHPEVEKGMECAGCHKDGRTRETRPVWHDLSWERSHSRYVKKAGIETDKWICYLCHSESQCSSCHRRRIFEQPELPQNHNQFWRLRGHGLAVGLDRSRCFSCHRSGDCERCHSQTRPLDHTALWGAPGNRHCLSCHFPIAAAGAQRCAVCHAGTPSHNMAPARPANALHVASANCRDCHTPLRHTDNGMDCRVCHK